MLINVRIFGQQDDEPLIKISISDDSTVEDLYTKLYKVLGDNYFRLVLMKSRGEAGNVLMILNQTLESAGVINNSTVHILPKLQRK